MGNELIQVIDRLVHDEQSPRVSILTWSDPTGLDGERARIAAKDAVEAVTDDLAAHDDREVRRRLAELAVRTQEPGFWTSHRTAGLGIFLSPAIEEVVDLPTAPEPAAGAGLVFRLLELFAASQQPGYIVLTLSSGAARVFSIEREVATAMQVPGMPAGLGEVARYADIEPTLQHHAGARGGAGMFHGQESGVRQMEHLIDRYLRLVDQALIDSRLLGDRPLVLAGVDEIVNAYRSITRIPQVVPITIRGNHDRTPGAELMARCRRTVPADAFDPARARDRAAVTDGGRGVLHDPKRVFHAAEEGRVEAVFLPARRGHHGLVLDEVAAAVHRNGGRVWIDEDGRTPEAITAVLRF